jgi:hypothetical protein
MAQTQRSPAADRASAVSDLGKISAAEHTTSAPQVQIVDDLGRRLPDRRGLVIVGGPTLAVSSVWRMAVDRWVSS